MLVRRVSKSIFFSILWFTRRRVFSWTVLRLIHPKVQLNDKFCFPSGHWYLTRNTSMLLAHFRIMFAESKDQTRCRNSSLSIPVEWRLKWNHIDKTRVGEITVQLHTLILSASQPCRSFVRTEILVSEALKSFSS